MNLKPGEQQEQTITINRRDFNLQQLLLLVLVSMLLHAVGLFVYARSQLNHQVKTEVNDPKPIEFTLVPEESAKTITKEKSNTSDRPVPPSQPAQPAPAAKSTPTAKNQTPKQTQAKTQVKSNSDEASIPQTEEPTKSQTESIAKIPDHKSVATSLPSKTPLPKAANPNGVSTSAGDLLGGDLQKNLASGGDAFFSPEALEYKSVLNPEQIKALKGIDLSEYLAQMEGKVKPNWNPSFRQDDRTTVLTFNIEKNGQVTGLKIAQSSGAKEADQQALAAVQKSLPFAPLPHNFPLKSLEITFSFNIHIY